LVNESSDIIGGYFLKYLSKVRLSLSVTGLYGIRWQSQAVILIIFLKSKSIIYKIKAKGLMEYKQAILVRQDLKLPKGKLAAQAAHASVDAVFKAGRETVKHWRGQGAKKVVLKVRDEKELYTYAQLSKDQGLPTSVITDAGRTVIAPGTVTCCGIGPDTEERVDSIVRHLPMQ
jgi:PTH2 family peptidyl-tRNA hydrolase